MRRRPAFGPYWGVLLAIGSGALGLAALLGLYALWLWPRIAEERAERERIARAPVAAAELVTDQDVFVYGRVRATEPNEAPDGQRCVGWEATAYEIQRRTEFRDGAIEQSESRRKMTTKRVVRPFTLTGALGDIRVRPKDDVTLVGFSQELHAGLEEWARRHAATKWSPSRVEVRLKRFGADARVTVFGRAAVRADGETVVRAPTAIGDGSPDELRHALLEEASRVRDRLVLTVLAIGVASGVGALCLTVALG